MGNSSGKALKRLKSHDAEEVRKGASSVLKELTSSRAVGPPPPLLSDALQTMGNGLGDAAAPLPRRLALAEGVIPLVREFASRVVRVSRVSARGADAAAVAQARLAHVQLVDTLLASLLAPALLVPLERGGTAAMGSLGVQLTSVLKELGVLLDGAILLGSAADASLAAYSAIGALARYLGDGALRQPAGDAAFTRDATLPLRTRLAACLAAVPRPLLSEPVRAGLLYFTLNVARKSADNEALAPMLSLFAEVLHPTGTAAAFPQPLPDARFASALFDLCMRTVTAPPPPPPATVHAVRVLQGMLKLRSLQSSEQMTLARVLVSMMRAAAQDVAHSGAADVWLPNVIDLVVACAADDAATAQGGWGGEALDAVLQLHPLVVPETFASWGWEGPSPSGGVAASLAALLSCLLTQPRVFAWGGARYAPVVQFLAHTCALSRGEEREEMYGLVTVAFRSCKLAFLADFASAFVTEVSLRLSASQITRCVTRFSALADGRTPDVPFADDVQLIDETTAGGVELDSVFDALDFPPAPSLIDIGQVRRLAEATWMGGTDGKEDFARMAKLVVDDTVYTTARLLQTVPQLLPAMLEQFSRTRPRSRMLTNVFMRATAALLSEADAGGDFPPPGPAGAQLATHRAREEQLRARISELEADVLRERDVAARLERARAQAVDSMTCAICLDNFLSNEPSCLECGHVFCLPCIKAMAGGHASISCPICRHQCSVQDAVRLRGLG